MGLDVIQVSICGMVLEDLRYRVVEWIPGGWLSRAVGRFSFDGE